MKSNCLARAPGRASASLGCAHDPPRSHGDDLDDDEGGRLHLAWSRSGRTLGVSISDKNFANFRQVSLLPGQIQDLIGFLMTSFEERRPAR